MDSCRDIVTQWQGPLAPLLRLRGGGDGERKEAGDEGLTGASAQLAGMDVERPSGRRPTEKRRPPPPGLPLRE